MRGIVSDPVKTDCDHFSFFCPLLPPPLFPRDEFACASAAVPVVMLLGACCVFLPGLFSLPPLTATKRACRILAPDWWPAATGSTFDFKTSRHKNPWHLLDAGRAWSHSTKASGWKDAEKSSSAFIACLLGWGAVLSGCANALIGAKLVASGEGFIAGLLIASCWLLIPKPMAKTDRNGMACILPACSASPKPMCAGAGLPKPLNA